MGNREKVVHLTTVHHPFDTRIYHKECVSLHKAGFDVSLIVPLEGKMPEEVIQTKEGIRLIATKKRKNRLARMLISTFDTYRIAKNEQADYYHIHDPELLWVGKLLKRKTNTVIYDVHEDYQTSLLQKDYLPKPIKKLFAKIYHQIEAFLIKQMDICLAEKYYQENYPTGQLILNYPVLNKDLISQERAEQPVADAIIYTGNVTEERGSKLHALIPTIDSYVNVHIYGKCVKPIADEMKRIASNSEDRLHFTGIDQFVPREAIDQAYISKNWLAGMAIFPPSAHYERKELTKFFEYMTAGIPIICSNFPVWQAFIDKHKCGLTVDPNEPEQWQEALNFLRDNPIEREQMIENGRRAVLTELNWETEEEKLINWYQTIQKSSNEGEIR